MSFERVPEDLRTDHLTVRCLIADEEAEMCEGYFESVDIDPSDVWVDGYDRIHFADHVPTECPECGDRVLSYNGVEVVFHA